MSLKKLHDLFEWPVMILFFVGIITAAFDIKIGGFTPVSWFLVSLWFLLMIVCFEATMIREHLEKER